MFHMNRRRFLQTSAVAGSSLVVPFSIARALGANDRMGVAIIGAGIRGKAHLAGWLGDKRSDVVMIVDADESRAATLGDAAEKKQGFRPKLVTDMRHAFDNKDVDVISSATPNHWHALSGIWAMQAGKDAYVEKPVCHNITEGRALIAAARKYKRMCQVGTQLRSHAALRDAIAFVHEGGIGKVKFARGLCYNRRKAINAKGNYAIPKEVDFNLWSGPAQLTSPKVTRKQFHYDWHWQRHYGNGDLGNQGPHQTDIARWGLGIDTHPNSVISYGGRLGYQAERKDAAYVDAGDTANTVVSINDYGEKCIVFETRGLDVSTSDDNELNKLFQTKGYKVGVVFYGTEGYLVQMSYAHCVAYDKDFKVINEFKGAGDHFGNFLDACVSRKVKDLYADVREGHLSAAISHLGNISYYLGENNKVTGEQAGTVLSDIKSLDDNQKTLSRTLSHLKKNGVDLVKYPISLGPLLKFDPKKETFTNSAAANKLLSRDYRKGFVCPTADQV